MFKLDSQLAQDTVILGRFPLCLVLLSRDANYPWCILVPQRQDVREIFHLTEEDRLQLMCESSHLAEVMADLFVPDKMNIAALGNMVPQLHIHHVARLKADGAWPQPIWGVKPAKSYADAELRERAASLRSALAGVEFEPIESLDDLPEGDFEDRTNV